MLKRVSPREEYASRPFSLHIDIMTWWLIAASVIEFVKFIISDLSQTTCHYDEFVLHVTLVTFNLCLISMMMSESPMSILFVTTIFNFICCLAGIIVLYERECSAGSSIALTVFAGVGMIVPLVVFATADSRARTRARINTAVMNV